MTTETLVTAPLAVSRRNPRYFETQDADGTGAHRLPDRLAHEEQLPRRHGPRRGVPGRRSGSTTTRTWSCSRTTATTSSGSGAGSSSSPRPAGGSFHCCMTPQPWPRTGPGTATDGKPKFDLVQFDDAYFDRLRERVIAAGERAASTSP